MDKKATEQLEKILALADSQHDGEAVAALRKARQMLAKDGMGFGDLARAAGKPRFSFALSGNQGALENYALRLRQQMQEIQAEMLAQATQLSFWRNRATELEHNLNSSRSQATRWQKLACDTAEKLWDISRQIEGDLDAPLAETASRQAG